MKLSEYAHANSISYTTAYRHFQEGLIQGAYQLESGTIVIPKESVPNKTIVITGSVDKVDMILDFINTNFKTDKEISEVRRIL